MNLEQIRAEFKLTDEEYQKVVKYLAFLRSTETLRLLREEPEPARAETKPLSQ